MPAEKIVFKNQEGQQLSARLELPAHQHPHTYAVFAHCFTCNKNLTAVRNISRALNLSGVAVLRFDFTGLGDSEGEFAATNFSSNVGDLLAACDFLANNYTAPALLVGHSLGGAAVLAAAAKVDSVHAVATIGAPSDPAHVSHLFDSKIEEIKQDGAANVTIGGRKFQVRKQFLEDIQEQHLTANLADLRKAVLILHSPQDNTVEIENAAKLYQAAFHPKSFVSLDGADHLLSQKADSIYAGDLIACWAKRYLKLPDNASNLRMEQPVAARLGNQGLTTDVMVRQHGLTADEPVSVGGNDFGATPFELVSAGLGACTVMTLQMYARRKKWELEEVIVGLEHKKVYPATYNGPENPKMKQDVFERVLTFKGNLTSEQRSRLLEIANKCPVHRTLESDIEIKTRLK